MGSNSIWAITAALAILAVGPGCSSSTPDAGEPAAKAGKVRGKAKAKRGKRARRSPGVQRQPTVVFVVLDTVRSSNLQICG